MTDDNEIDNSAKSGGATRKDHPGAILQGQELRYFYWVVFLWSVSVVCVTLLASFIELDVSELSFVRYLQGKVVSIVKWSAISSEPETFRVAWVYIVLTAPALILYLVTRLRLSKVPDLGGAIIVLAPAVWLLGSLCTSASFLGHDFSAPRNSGRYDAMTGSISGGLSFYLFFSVGFILSSTVWILLVCLALGLKKPK